MALICITSRSISAQNPLWFPILLLSSMLCCFFSDCSGSSLSHPSFFLLQSRRPHSPSNPPESALASGLLHLLFPRPGRPLSREPAPMCSSLTSFINSEQPSMPAHLPSHPPQHCRSPSSNSAHLSSRHWSLPHITSLLNFILNYGKNKQTNIKFSILTTFKCTVQWC